MMLVHYTSGQKHPAVILSLNGDMMRVALRDSDDVEEYRLVKQIWVSSNCEPVTFEFPLGIFEAIGMMPPGPMVPSRQ